MANVNNIYYINIFKNNNLTNNEKLLLLDFITILGDDLSKPIQETNDELARHCSLTGRSVATMIKNLKDKKYIRVEYNGHFRKIKIIR